MVNNNNILKFATLTGCATSKHLMRYFGVLENRQINRVLTRLLVAGYLLKSGTIRSDGPGKPVPIYTPTHSGFTQAGVNKREVNSLTALTRSILLAEVVSSNNDIDYMINIEEKDDAFALFDLKYPHRDKWYAGNLVFKSNNRPHVIVAFTDYQAALRMCKDHDKREINATYHIIVSSVIFEKISNQASKYTNPFSLYDISRNYSEWSDLGKTIINSSDQDNSKNDKDYALNQVKKILKQLQNNPDKKALLQSNVKLSKQKIGLILSGETQL